MMTCARAMAGAACRASGISGIPRRRRRLCDGKETGEGGSGVSWTAGMKKSRKKIAKLRKFHNKSRPKSKFTCLDLIITAPAVSKFEKLRRPTFRCMSEARAARR